MRTTLESEWSWRVAAFAASRGYKEHEIQAMLRGPLSAPDVTALLTAARNTAPDARSEASGISAAPVVATAARDLASPEGEGPREGEVPATVGETEAANVAAAEASGAEGIAGRQEAAALAADDPAREILSENVEHLSRNDREGEDREGTTSGTGLVAAGGAQDGEPGR